MSKCVTIEEIETKLSKTLPVHSVDQLPQFPYKTYSEFLKGYRRGEVDVLATYYFKALSVLGRRGEIIVHHTLLWAPYVVMLVSVPVSVALTNFWILFAIPLAGLGMLIGMIPGLMRAFGNKAFLVAVVGFIAASIGGNLTAACLIGAYCLSGGLTIVARHQCALIMRRGALQSELILIWLYLELKMQVRPTVG